MEIAMKNCPYCGKENDGYVRIQVSPKDYEAAKELLSGAGPKV
jgi:hypothetical protein